MKSFKFILSSFVAVLLLCFIGCGGGGGNNFFGYSGSNTGDDGSSAPGTPYSVFGATDSIQTSTETEDVVIGTGTVKVIKNQVLIHAKEDITEQELANLEAKIKDLGGTIIGSITATRTIQVSVASTVDKAAFIAQIGAMPGVVSAGYNLVLSYEKSNITGYSEWLNKAVRVLKSAGLIGAPTAIYPHFDGDYWIEQIKAHEAWDLTTGSTDSGTVIGIVDSGISKEQTVLDSGRIKRFDEKGNPWDDDDSKNADRQAEHGTWVTGFAAGYKNDEDNAVRGVAWKNNVRMYDVGRVEEDCFIDILGVKLLCSRPMSLGNYILATKTAISNGASVINISIGKDGQTLDNQMAFRDGMSGAVDHAKKNGSLLIFASGNENLKNDDNLLTPGDDKNESAWHSHTIRVAATDKDKKDASDWGKHPDGYIQGSNMGKTVDIAAPGDKIGFGQGTGNGTSYAAPLVTGTAALIKSVNPSLAAPEIRYILIDSASPTVDTKYSPKIMLDAFTAVNNAKSTVGIELEPIPTTGSVSLSKGETKTVTVDVTVPKTTVKALDVLFLVDTTGSFIDDIATFKTKATEILNNLQGLGINVQFGVASFADYPLDPFGSSGDKAFYLNQGITSDITLVTAAINNLDNPMHNGNDTPESQLEALYQAATGAGRSFADSTLSIAPSNIGWRTGALKVIIMSTDANFHYPENEASYPQGATYDDTKNALQARGITVIGLDSGNTGGDLLKIVNDTRGTLYQLSSDSADIAQKIKAAIDATLASINLNVQKISDPDGWITNITPASFDSVNPGETKTFTIELTGKKNQPDKKLCPLNYTVYLWVKGNNAAISKRVKIPISVPCGE